MPTPKPTQADIAAATSLLIRADLTPIPKAIASWADIISRHMQPERELLCELAEQPITIETPVTLACLIERARQWKKENGL